MSDPTKENGPEARRTLSQLMDGEWHDIDPARCVAGVCDDDDLKAAWARWHVVRHALRGEGAPVAPPTLAQRISAAVAEEPAYTNVTQWPLKPSRATEPALAPVPVPGAGVERAGVERVGGRVGVRGPRVSRLGLTGFALAASTALVTVVGLNAWRDDAPAGVAAPGTSSAGDASLASAGGSDAPAGLAGLRIADAPVPSSPLPAFPLPVVDLVANTSAAGAGSYWVAGTGAAPGVRRGEAEARLNAFLSRHIESAPTAAQQGLLPYSRLVGYDEPRVADAPGAAGGTPAGR